MILDTNNNLAVTANGLTVNGSAVLTSLDFNSYKTYISYTSVGNINIMSANGFIPESGGMYGNIASTGWVQGKVADINARLAALEAKVG